MKKETKQEMTFLYKNSFYNRSIELKSKFGVNKIGPKSGVLFKSLFVFDKLSISELETPFVQLSARYPSVICIMRTSHHRI